MNIVKAFDIVSTECQLTFLLSKPPIPIIMVQLADRKEVEVDCL